MRGDDAEAYWALINDNYIFSSKKLEHDKWRWINKNTSLVTKCGVGMTSQTKGTMHSTKQMGILRYIYQY